MGANQSTQTPESNFSGYHVLKVQEGSPGELAGLQPFFDYVVALNGHRLDKDNTTLVEQLQANIGKPIPLIAYNSRTDSTRELTLLPSNQWGGGGLLGVSIRFCSFENACENVWHILEIHPNSPAAMAGLKSETDYIIGTADALLYDQSDLYTQVETHNKQSLHLYVYNSEEDSCREVTIVPDCDWGGDGCLGCSIGFGLLHRIPTKEVPMPISKPDSTNTAMPEQYVQQMMPGMYPPQQPQGYNPNPSESSQGYNTAHAYAQPYIPYGTYGQQPGANTNMEGGDHGHSHDSGCTHEHSHDGAQQGLYPNNAYLYPPQGSAMPPPPQQPQYIPLDSNAPPPTGQGFYSQAVPPQGTLSNLALHHANRVGKMGPGVEKAHGVSLGSNDASLLVDTETLNTRMAPITSPFGYAPSSNKATSTHTEVATSGAPSSSSAVTAPSTNDDDSITATLTPVMESTVPSPSTIGPVSSLSPPSPDPQDAATDLAVPADSPSTIPLLVDPPTVTLPDTPLAQDSSLVSHSTSDPITATANVDDDDTDDVSLQ